MRRLNCVLTGCKKKKLSSEDDDDIDDESDVPLPAVRVKLTTQEFYDQHKDKVQLVLSYFYSFVFATAK